MKTRVEYYQDVNGEWRWRAKRGGRIVAEGGEGYRSKVKMMRSAARFFTSIVEAKVYEVVLPCQSQRKPSPRATSSTCAT